MAVVDQVAGRDIHRPKHSESRNKEIKNLFECHACKRQTGISTRKDRLRVLESQWRIVLLCKQCHERVESAQLCSYCLTDVTLPRKDGKVDGWGSIHKCSQCSRQIHEECISWHSSIAPFSYLPGAGDVGIGEFSMCIDCWMPRLLENREGGTGSRAVRRVPVGIDLCNLVGLSLGSGCGEKRPRSKSPEDVANKAHFVARKKRFVANKAKRKAKRKDEAAKRAVKLAICAIDLIAEKRPRNEKDGSGSSNCCDEVGSINYNVEQLTFELHRLLNTSPRIAKSLHFSDGVCKESYLVSKLNCHSLVETLPSQLTLHMTAMESIVPPEGSSSKSVYIEQKNSINGIVGHYPCLKKFENDHQLMQHGLCGSEPDPNKRKYTRRTSAIKQEHDHQLMQSRRCYSQPDRYMRKYSRRSSANILDLEHDHQMMQNGSYSSEPDRYSRKYTRRSFANILEHGHQLMQNGNLGSVLDPYSRKYIRGSSANILEHDHQMMQNGGFSSEPDRYSRKYTRRSFANTLEYGHQLMQNGSFGSETY